MSKGELRRWWPWLMTVASSFAPIGYTEDVAQEGWIEMWRVAGKHDGSGSLDVWLKHCAKQRMRNAARDIFRRIERERKIMIELGPPPVLWSVFRNHESDQDIAHAVASLTPRQQEYVRARFWTGMQTTELIEHFRVEPSGIWKGARKKLLHHLSHLHEERIAT